jgi:translation initiation factor IF-1
MYRIRLSGGRILRAGIDVASRGTLVKVIPGDKVAVRIAARDPSRGQIVRKI